MTSHVAKSVERLLSATFVPHLCQHSRFGPNQFAYQKQKGARDAIAYLTLSWLQALSKRKKVGVYCSDVAGAFDRVCSRRMIAKLRAAGLCNEIVTLISSWLRCRNAKVVVEGTHSEEIQLENMVFQGTVWGCILWNVFYEDSRRAITETGHNEIIYADDLNAWKVYQQDESNDDILSEARECQQNLHQWGGTNRVSFDPLKESMHVLSFTDPQGALFRILGILYDPRLTMSNAVSELVSQCRWKIQMLLRSRQYYCDSDLILLYKAHVLSYIEYKTPAIYHAAMTILDDVDSIQRRFLNEVGITEINALLYFNLAPLKTRRDIAMLGVIHRASVGKGPEQLQKLFPPAEPVGRRSARIASNLHTRQRELLIENTQLGVIERSAFGLVRIYNMLPQHLVDSTDVSIFQAKLQDMVKIRARSACVDWANTYCPRMPLDTHPARRL